MSKQSVCLVEFSTLYNIFDEMNDLLSFKVLNYQSSKEFMTEIESKNPECINSTIIIDKNNASIFSSFEIIKNNILVLDSLPVKIEKLFDKINTQLIKQKYNFQSNFQIKNYTLNLNSRIITYKKTQLKLTEKEIDIILFLKEQKLPQSINKLQHVVWGYAFNLETHTVETHIYRLRKKIKDKFNDEKFIVSHEEGYVI
tara:strand:- start:1599 stop:2195 length:597 start_codon:yes stop_codon:yes gene_type:complete